jgi:hypothetical protein
MDVRLLTVMFAALLVLIRIDGLARAAARTLLSELASAVFGRGAVYSFIQAATALELVFAAVVRPQRAGGIRLQRMIRVPAAGSSAPSRTTPHSPGIPGGTEPPAPETT